MAHFINIKYFILPFFPFLGLCVCCDVIVIILIMLGLGYSARISLP